MPQKTAYDVAVVGATGAVGQKIIQLLEEKDFPINELKLLSSKRSAGSKQRFKEKELTVEEATPESFSGVDIALFSAGGSVSKALAPEAVKRGAVVVDNTSAFRMDENVPLVVPEVNKADLQNHEGIIANPNCSTIQMVAALKPLKDAFGLERVIVSTYQAVSGAGNQANMELEQQSKDYLDNKEMEASLLPVKGDKKHFPIAFNALPQIDVFQDNGYTFEEMKMINETKKIMHAPELSVAATCVRLPFFTSHAESVYIEVNKEGVTVADLWNELKHAEGVILEDDPSAQLYPTPLSASNKEAVFVGRVRKDPDKENGFHLWVVSDNLMKGAAWNTVQIAQSLIENNWLQR
ncbi:MAG: aspartate-semialdehyde dehydrogenase [Bacillota bacterium]|uniref:Aspartate-semialdehyde dehydrogenase n=1 Tax=Virgibacillus salarius TaxID=447199 RepID=A0A941DQR6_9BACI|nr:MULTISPECIES: aspartate-semialdehyde dehydrogenase [Bacillaceae]NAZ07535.1 aspartate-semialdehyde dehydrogenase [Agaribacter marinus]MBR7794815.1 aspartate-semialdehyde dehydrogenase [Virgibacillus salarius]MCC2249229.1 aspartate-semialdehyde dehydrogenase [Virgibacillus sp. AGTR]MDY7045022.1 aspartate-semialdehyde dehydrogenase [Virgibacillus sp. M23]QRZ17264.1 aspartate-semialdehyde dehydrogenase [Virgibacillus sp. AGTR]